LVAIRLENHNRPLVVVIEHFVEGRQQCTVLLALAEVAHGKRFVIQIDGSGAAQKRIEFALESLLVAGEVLYQFHIVSNDGHAVIRRQLVY
jgi:methionine-rich copper-binding protein CopC